VNKFMQDRWSWIEGTHGMRALLLDGLGDADLAFNPGGQNVTLGALLREIGEIEHAYVQSLKSFKQDFAYRNTAPGLDGSLAQLRAWYQTLDDEMKAIVSGFSDDDLHQTVERGGGFAPAVEVQLDIYLQALLIFFGKAVIYLRAMNKPLPKPVQDYIA
jgi:DinB superfamily